jgi:hypothetical protein
VPEIVLEPGNTQIGVKVSSLRIHDKEEISSWDRIE